MQNSLINYPPREDYSYARTNDGVELTNAHEVHHNQQQQQATEGSYSSPASTISLHGTPHSRDLAMPISTSSELAFALERPTDLVFILVFFSITSFPVLIEVLLVNRHLEVDRNLIRHLVTIRISSLLVLQLPIRTQMPTVLLTELPPITTRQIFTLSKKPMERSRLKVACINRRRTALLSS
jgi:hypothetical protein